MTLSREWWWNGCPVISCYPNKSLMSSDSQSSYGNKDELSVLQKFTHKFTKENVVKLMISCSKLKMLICCLDYDLHVLAGLCKMIFISIKFFKDFRIDFSKKSFKWKEIFEKWQYFNLSWTIVKSNDSWKFSIFVQIVVIICKNLTWKN